MKVLVIGGTGFLGGCLLTELNRHGYDITVLTRSPQKAAMLAERDIRSIQGDLMESQTFLSKLSHQDAVISVAMPEFTPGRISNSTFKKLQKQTTAYFSSALAAARKCACPLVLTLGTSFRTVGDTVADETWPIERFGMTAMGTQVDPLIEKAQKAGEPPLIQMLPGEIYGPGGLFKNVMYRWMKTGRYRVIGRGANYMPRIHVEDCARAYVHALQRMPLGEKFILADDTPCTMREFSDYMADTMNVPRHRSIPAFLVRLAMGRRIFETVTMNCMVFNTKAKAMLNWSLIYPGYRQGLPATISAIESAGNGVYTE